MHKRMDEAVRARLAPLRALYSGLNRGNMFCSGCGIGADNWTPGCRPCGDRWRKWLKNGTVTPQRFLEEKNRVNDYADASRRREGNIGDRSKAKRPSSTWSEHRRNFGLTEGIIPKKRKKP